MHTPCLAFVALFLLWQPMFAQEKLAPRQLAAAQDTAADSELQKYVARPDENFRWELREKQTVQNCEVLRLHLTSQRWQGIDWHHVMYLIKPSNLAASRQDALLVVSGGDWKAEWPNNGPETVPLRGEAQLMASVASQFGCVIAVLNQVPFQPIMDGKHEDEIIAATFAKFIETQDPSWPLLLPMVKSAVRGMDATVAAAKHEWNLDLSTFTVTGASKRGWTTWLTGATDPRVTAIAPMVIDMLNMSQQMPHQLVSFGEYSEQIADYTELNLPKFLSTPGGQQLQSIVDPFSYRKKLTLPKLLIFGTNDRYWPLDACNLYWNELEGEKHLLYCPNQGHGITDYARVIGSASALHRSRHGGRPLPKLDWSFSELPSQVQLDVTASKDVDTVRGWVATAPTRDFRDAKWEERICKTDGNGTWGLSVAKPATGFVACFAESVWIPEGMPAFFSTNVKIFAAE